MRKYIWFQEVHLDEKGRLMIKLVEDRKSGCMKHIFQQSFGQERGVED